jgi:hypothetical protein
LVTFENISGFDFAVTDTDCDIIAKEHWFTVVASRAGQRRETLLSAHGQDRAAGDLVGDIAKRTIGGFVDRLRDRCHRVSEVRPSIVGGD